ncbi:unnamed protein product [Brachionus calyciflorus]|uniref:Mitochondrial chaperone BCS1 n=1 Tax=Brachionus calyciflorus TaxID=104777 RepID=A0A814B9A1_9BILA|nr:unnamed protein product [Brachionus calyciflorus]
MALKPVPVQADISLSDKASFFDSLKENPYFSAGFGLVGIGAGLSLLKRGTAFSYTLLQKRFTVSLEIVSRDKSYDWTLKWINSHLKQRARHISVETFFQKNDKNQRVATSFSFAPSVGVHFFKYKSNWIRAERVRETMVDRNTGSPVETLKLTTLGTKTDIFQDMLLQARQSALSEQSGKTLIYHAGLGGDWGLFGWPKDKRPFKSVVLDDGIAENMKNDILDFLKSSKWYYERGIPYRRGYLLYGPPGCGKTSFITALAATIEHDIAILNLSDRGLTDDRLNVLFARAPLNSIILLEDIDAAFGSRDIVKNNPTAYQGFSPLTLSGLLNALDGVASSEGRIVIMTTNYVDRLDPALIRPGRVDVKQFIGYATRSQIERMFNNFYPNTHHGISHEFANKLIALNRNFSSAQIQGFFMLHKNDPNSALQNCDSYFNKF